MTPHQYAASKGLDGILAIATELTEGDRQDDYGPPHEDFARTASMVNALYGTTFSGSDVVTIMMLVKISRNRNKPKRDSVVDGAGYNACLDACYLHEEAY